MTILSKTSPSLLAVAALGCAALPALAQGNPSHWCTYLGGSQDQESIQAVAVAPGGDVLVAGWTTSSNLPVTAGAFNTQANSFHDAFVARLSPDGSRILACTYLGGNFREEATFVGVAADGSVWVGGSTESSDFPTTTDSLMTFRGVKDAFIVNLDANLQNLRFSTLLGGSGTDTGEAFAIDDQNQRIYMAGATALFQGAVHTPVPTTSTALQRAQTNFGDLYLAVLDRSTPGTTTLAYGTLLGGNHSEPDVGDLTLEGNGVVTLSGETRSTDFPTTAGALRTSNSTRSGFLARIDTGAAGAAGLLYSSYVGGSGSDYGVVHTTDSAGIVHFALTSSSTNLPVTPNALQPTNGPPVDVYYGQLDMSQTSSAGLRYGSWVATVGLEEAVDIAVVGGQVALLSQVNAYSPTTAGAFIQSRRTPIHGLVQILDLTSQPAPFISYATLYEGCRFSTYAKAMAFDGNEVVLVGHGDDAPVTPGAAQVQKASLVDALVGRLQLGPWPSPFQSFGTACAGTTGPPQMVGRGYPRLCGTLGLRATALPAHSQGILFAGFDRTQYNGTPLPFPLAALGAPGCEVVAAPEVILFRVANNLGNVDLDIRLPNLPGLLGTVLYSQFALLDLPANNLGMVTSNGLAAEVRW